MTWECWVKFTGTNGTLETIWENRSSTGSNDGFLIGRFHTSGHENKIEMFTASDYRITTDVTVADNVWTHVAYSRDGNSAEARIYINGTEAGSFTDGYNYDSTGTAYIGRNASNSHRMQGYITNMRFVKGQSLYTSNFTVPTEPLTSTSQGATASNTKFIICNSSDIEEGTVLASGLSISESGFSSNDSSSQTGIFAGAPEATPTASTFTAESISGVPNTGYFGAGDPGNNNSIKKFNFANETTSTIPATVSQSRELTAGTSSITYGYFSGGQSPKYSITDRVQYSNDTSSRIPGANTTTAIAGAMGSGTRTFGILLGGEPSSDESSLVQKLTFASETFANDGNLSEGAKSSAVVTQPQQKAYLSVGQVAAGDNRSEVEKYTFSTSTTSSAPNSIRALKYQTGMGSLTAGYVTGGPLGGGAGESAVDKLTYSTETWSTLSTTMSAGKYLAGGLNNTTVGVFCGGIPSTGGSTTQRVTFSTDTVARIPGADWASNWYRINGAGARMNSAYASNPNVI